MKYMLLMYANESEMQEWTQEESQAWFQTWQTLFREAKDAGVLLANNGLSPVANATTVRIREGKTLITDGPFAETHEQLGGFFFARMQGSRRGAMLGGKDPPRKVRLGGGPPTMDREIIVLRPDRRRIELVEVFCQDAC